MHNDLAARVEAASGPDRELDAEVALAIGWTDISGAGFVGIWERPYGGMIKLPAFTASLDAAMMLVPEGLYPTIDFVTNRVWLRTAEGYDAPNGVAYGFANTVPNSLAAASLRARGGA